MEHQPFKMWLEDRSNLNEDEEEILRNHISACQECASLDRDLRNMENYFSESPVRAPRAGFTRRFLASLPERREIEQAHQVKRWMVGLFIALSVNLLLIASASILTGTTFVWLVNLASFFGNILGVFQQTNLVLRNMSLIIPQSVWLPIVIVAFAWGIAGLGIWVWTMRRIYFTGAAYEA
ncbi:MAG: hypothetical protein HGA28_08650 [Anaerolineaceae bacterium]|nr:hypothetical protein [Anaerolineaceae bacterium]